MRMVESEMFLNSLLGLHLELPDVLKYVYLTFLCGAL